MAISLCGLIVSLLGCVYLTVSLPACFSPYGDTGTVVKKVDGSPDEGSMENAIIHVDGARQQAVFLVYIGIGVSAMTSVIHATLLVVCGRVRTHED